jgi:alpha-glucosidase (family GH31 glycosyl hydrolase)
MIDDNWQEEYGNWEFKVEKLHSAKEMIKKIHKLGFKVMLWVCPFVNADSPYYRFLEKENEIAFKIVSSVTSDNSKIQFKSTKEIKQIQIDNSEVNVNRDGCTYSIDIVPFIGEKELLVKLN